MTNEVKKALDTVSMTYDELVAIAYDSINDMISDTDDLIEELKNSIANLSNDMIRHAMVTIAIRAYSLSEQKDLSIFKASLAKIISENNYAQLFTSSEGTVASKESNALINNVNEILANEVYSLVSSTMKTKLDELHRITDVLKTVLFTRAQEAKLTDIDTM